MNKLIKIGRFAFLLPYLIMPIYCVLFENEYLETAILVSMLIPLLLDSPIVLVYPGCILISIICGIISSKKEPKTKKTFIGIIIAIIMMIVLHKTMLVIFLRNFKL